MYKLYEYKTQDCYGKMIAGILINRTGVPVYFAPVYFAPWTACPRPGYLHPLRANCPGQFIMLPAHTGKILLYDVYYYPQRINNYMQFLSYKYVNLRWLLKRSEGFRIDKEWGASCPGQFILAPAKNFRENG